MTIDMTGARPLRESEVTPFMRGEAKHVLGDSATYPMGATVLITPDVVARVEVHTWVGATGEQRPNGIRGVSLYKLGQRPAHERAQGVDVSSFQPKIDWPKVVASGVSFAYVKATEGKTYTSETFAAQWAGAKAAGLLRGAYHFFRIASGQAQVDHFLDVLGDDPGELPPMLDVEWQHNPPGHALDHVDPQRFADVVMVCLERLKARSGRRPMVYTAPDFASLLPSWEEPARIADLWIAKYGPEPTTLAPWPRWAFWQYTDRKQVPGIGPDDANLFCGTVEELHAWAAGGGLPPIAIDTPKAVQHALNLLGFAHPLLEEDGDIGKKSKAAIAAFQASIGLLTDGNDTPGLRASLAKALTARA